MLTKASRIIALDSLYGERNPDLEKIQQAQDEYTVSMKDTECQQKIEALIGQIGNAIFLLMNRKYSTCMQKLVSISEALKATHLKGGEG